MKYFMLILFITGLCTGCKDKNGEKVNYPSQSYEFVKMDTSKLSFHQSVYVPIYSHIYDIDGTSNIDLTATLSIRSTDFTDSIFVSKVDYYDSNGKLIKKYIDSTLLVKPMHSVEFIVAHTEKEGGAGANFIIEWSAKKQVSPLIQAVMLSTYHNVGISFAVDGVTIKN